MYFQGLNAATCLQWWEETKHKCIEFLQRYLFFTLLFLFVTSLYFYSLYIYTQISVFSPADIGGKMLVCLKDTHSVNLLQ